MDVDAFYSSTEWKKKRALILRRDKYQCQVCKRYGRNREAGIVHHKLELEEYPELALDNNNLISVCLSCHNKIHPEKGIRTLREHRIQNR